MISSKLNARATKNGILITEGMTITRLVRQIQRCEGHFPCFRTDAREHCEDKNKTCEWADECKHALIAHWKR